VTADVVTPEATTRPVASGVLRSPRGLLSVGFLVLVVVACALAPWIAPDDPLHQDFAAVRQGPSAAHLLGTDTLGRDVLSRLLHGGTATLLAVLEAVVVRLLLGLPLGIAAGYLGGWWDRAIGRVTDVAMSIPTIVVLLSVLTLFDRNLSAAMIIFGVMTAFGFARVVRSSALATREELYVSAAQVIGLSGPQIMVRHILPRARGVIVVQTSLIAAIALGVQTGLTYLGLGPPPPAPTWGGMVGEAAGVVQSFPWLLAPSGGLIGLTVLALGTLGDVVRDTTADRTSAHAGLRAQALPRPERPPAEGVPAGALLSVEGVRITFETSAGTTTVVQDASFWVRPGETVGLIGESGSGKTVTARAVLGLLPDNGRVADGRIMFDGRDLSRLDARELRAVRGRRIGLVSQEPMRSLDPSMRIGAQLAELVTVHDGLKGEARRQRVLELLGQVQIPDPEEFLARFPHEISGGTAQRVVLALALAGRPDLLIADEPTTALDVTVQAEILDLLRRVQAQTGMAILLVTHDWGVVADLCRRVVVLYAGQVVEAAGVEEVFRAPRHPYTAALLAAAPGHRAGDRRLTAISGQTPTPREWPQGCHFAARCPLVIDECRVGPIPVSSVGADHHTRCLRRPDLVVGLVAELVPGRAGAEPSREEAP